MEYSPFRTARCLVLLVTVISLMSAERDYSHFLFLGDSLFEWWHSGPTYYWVSAPQMEQSDAEAVEDKPVD